MKSSCRSVVDLGRDGTCEQRSRWRWQESLKHLALAAMFVVSVTAGSSGTAPTQDRHNPSSVLLGQQPLVFVENLGQWPEPTRLLARRSGVYYILTDDSLIMQMVRELPGRLTPAEESLGMRMSARRSVFRPKSEGDACFDVLNLRFVFEAGAHDSCVEGTSEQAGRFHYLLGRDPAGWRTDVRSFAQARYPSLYPGVDIVLRDGGSGFLEYDLHVAPGAHEEQVVIRVDGASAPLRIDEAGALLVDTSFGEVRQARPSIWEIRADGTEIPLEGAYRLLGTDRFSFDVPGRDRNLPVVIDPGLIYSTYLGTSSDDRCEDVAIDEQGRAYVVGWTASAAFPTTSGAFQTTMVGAPKPNVFVTKFERKGPFSGAGASTPLYSTYIGGSEHDYGASIHVTAAGIATVVGYTLSPNFPTTVGAYDTVCGCATGGSFDAFVARLNATGSSLTYSTFLGGSAGYAPDDDAWDLRVFDTGEIVVVGQTGATDFPTTPGAYQTTISGTYPHPPDAFVSFLNPVFTGAAQLTYSTYLGGQCTDSANAVAVDPLVRIAVVAGQTNSGNFPSTPLAYDSTFNATGTPSPCDEPNDAFVARVDPSQIGAAQLVYSSFLGALGYDEAADVALITTSGSLGAPVVVGRTTSTAFPTTSNAYAGAYGGSASGDAFVTRFTATGGSLDWSSFLGGSGWDQASGIGLDRSGRAVVVGVTDSANFPVTTGAFDTTLNPQVSGLTPTEGFVALMKTSVIGVSYPAPDRLSYATYLGGRYWDFAYGVAFGDQPTETSPCGSAGPFDGNEILCMAVVAGITSSDDFPTTMGAYDTTYNEPPPFLPVTDYDGFVSALDLFPVGANPYCSSTSICGMTIRRKCIGVNSIPQSGNANFAITCSGAQPGTPESQSLLYVIPGGCHNACVYDTGAQVCLGWFVGGACPETVFSSGTQSDGEGYARKGFPLVGIPPGSRFQVQWAWIDGCGGANISISNAVEVVIQ